MIIRRLEGNFARWQVVVQNQRVKNEGFYYTYFIVDVASVWTLVATSRVPDALEDHVSLDEVARGGVSVAPIVDQERRHIWDDLAGQVLRCRDEVGEGYGRRPGKVYEVAVIHGRVHIHRVSYVLHGKMRLKVLKA